jgi:hypothetical protein
MGADVEFWTNEQPPLFNKLDVNNRLQPMSMVSEAWLG